MLKLIREIVVNYNSVHVRWALYVSIAFLMSLYNELSNFKSMAEISDLKMFMILVFATLQSLIAWRAFIDQSLSQDQQKSGLYATPKNTTTPPTSGV